MARAETEIVVHPRGGVLHGSEKARAQAQRQISKTKRREKGAKCKKKKKEKKEYDPIHMKLRHRQN